MAAARFIVGNRNRLIVRRADIFGRARAGIRQFRDQFLPRLLARDCAGRGGALTSRNHLFFPLRLKPGGQGNPHRSLFIIGSRSRMILTTTGPTVTTNSAGRMQKKIGNTSLMPILAARVSASCRAAVRM